MEKHFLHFCGNCKAKNKIVDRCDSCYKMVCSECSIYGLCIDCFVQAYCTPVYNFLYDLEVKLNCAVNQNQRIKIKNE
jgi:hypothetical protein